VAGDLKRELRLAKETTAHVVSCDLPNGQSIKIGEERFLACEVLFKPEECDLVGCSGLAEEVSCLLCTLVYVIVSRFSTAL
jgi:hypothetical protein